MDGQIANHGQASASPPVASTRQSSTNHLLAALPAADYARIAPSLETIPLKLQGADSQAGRSDSSMCISPAADSAPSSRCWKTARMVEVATIGREGMVGVSAILTERRPNGPRDRCRWCRRHPRPATGCPLSCFARRWIGAARFTSC